ncbi:unnamed protein product [Notodromas monacha]|uniref:VLIG-type G domain-containing protein n=1 Tax=Notodromas monacha TaxID=399045 RepID=A0A7R9BGU3_9CRUS|nr:unnamed protein product [Notodromas monacha]CAG0914130.1 unnamed protein product [Notodromas monacha]
MASKRRAPIPTSAIESSRTTPKFPLELHPLDKLVLLVQSSDDFVRQSLFRKLFSCGRALPLIIPVPSYAREQTGASHELLLWACSDIFIAHHRDGRVKLSDWSGPLVSVLELGGDDGDSDPKEMLLRHTWFDDHPVFSEDTESEAVKLVSDGCVEMGFHVGENIEKGQRSSGVDALVMNLSGCPTVHGAQFRFLLQHSSALLFFVSSAANEEVVKRVLQGMQQVSRGKHVAVFWILNKGVNEKLFGECESLGHTVMAKTRSNVLQRKLRDIMTSVVTDPLLCRKASDLWNHYPVGIKCDEDLPACQEAKTKVQAFLAIWKNQIRRSASALPLLRLWLEFSRAFRLSLAKRTGVSRLFGEEQDAFDEDEKKSEMREKQVVEIKSNRDCAAKLLADLFTSLYVHSSAALCFGYIWLAQFSLSIKRDRASSLPRGSLFVLFLRELAQYYEACMASGDVSLAQKVSVLPEIFAHLLMSGFPIELIDGDGENIPMTWIKAVMNELKRDGRVRLVHVLSVLGTQSSGKSTLLNAMFGSNFLAHSGKATRGVFIQLLPMESDRRILNRTMSSASQSIDGRAPAGRQAPVGLTASQGSPWPCQSPVHQTAVRSPDCWGTQTIG